MNINFTPFPKLTTNRLILRQLNINDVNALQRQRSNDEVNKYLDRPKSITIEECEAFIKNIDANLANNISGYWVLTLKNDDTLIGTICLWNLQPEKDIADIGYELSPAYQGQGLMQEAVEKLVEYGFDTMQLKVIIGVTDARNKKSGKVLECCNFKKDLDHTYVSEEEAEGGVVYFLKKP
jgi:[ribosomal protein S5]-alanine N-acetyltransferase